MRYKFRGKSIDTGKWVYGDLIHREPSGERMYIHPHYEPMGSHQNHPIEVIPETVGQDTNLVDKNGTPIYEGDIVKTVALSNDHHQRGAITKSPVEYWCGNACLSITYTPIYPFCLDHEIEVIGNIHNKEDTP